MIDEHAEVQSGTMTLFEHLAELRRRIIISSLAILVGGIVCWFFYDQILTFMAHPYKDYLRHHPNKNITKAEFVVTTALEGLTTRLKISVYGGFALATPVVFWQLWKFITPGLYKNEKRYIVPFVAAAVGLFTFGIVTAIFVFPKALNWLLAVGGKNVAPIVGPNSYITLYVTMCLVFGAVFMYPIIVVFLEIVGAVPSSKWRKWRRPAIVVMAIIAAVITPSSDPISFIAMMVPMYILYELSILVGRLLKK